MREAIFKDGVTTKSSATGARRGLGLALVRQVVSGRGGMISVGHDSGAVFTAVLPKCVAMPGDATSEIAEDRTPEAGQNATPDSVETGDRPGTSAVSS
jgi:hypothetical protein